VEVADLDSRLRSQFGIPAETEGALVLNVAPGTSAYEAGLRAGDIILEMNRQKVRNAHAAVELSSKVKDSALMRIWSKNGSRFLVVAGGKKR